MYMRKPFVTINILKFCLCWYIHVAAFYLVSLVFISHLIEKYNVLALVYSNLDAVAPCVVGLCRYLVTLGPALPSDNYESCERTLA